MTQKKGFFGWVSRLFGKKKEVYEAPAVILIEREEPKPAPVAEVKVEPKAEALILNIWDKFISLNHNELLIANSSDLCLEFFKVHHLNY